MFKSPMAIVGISVVAATVAFVLVMGFGNQVLENVLPNTTEPHLSECGSVFGGPIFTPEYYAEADPPFTQEFIDYEVARLNFMCPGTMDDRRAMMLWFGIPGLLLGVGLVVAGSRRTKQ